MPPTIRIDEEIYAWLQKNARPFEDTPNSVLRRVAGLENSSAPSTAKDIPSPLKGVKGRAPQEPQTQIGASGAGYGRIGLDGKQLNEEWKVGARHALFSRDGTWYENLERFPGALFDPKGYVLFKTQGEYRRNAHIKIGKKTNVAGGIASIPGYVRKP
jgi:5-methylcytosine-specific restriction protein A